MNKTLCAIAAMIIIALAIAFDAYLISGYSSIMFFTMSDRTSLCDMECIIWWDGIWNIGLQGLFSLAPI